MEMEEKVVDCSKHGKQKGVWWGGGIFSCHNCGGGRTTQFICAECDKQSSGNQEEDLESVTFANFCEKCGKA